MNAESCLPRVVFIKSEISEIFYTSNMYIDGKILYIYELKMDAISWLCLAQSLLKCKVSVYFK